MSLQFTVLASGSAGNASLLEVNGFGLLLDAGLGPRLLASRLKTIGASWQGIRAVLLTHTHSDHWNENTLLYLQRLRIPFYCHTQHQHVLLNSSPAFAALRAEDLVRAYGTDAELNLTAGLSCRPFPLRHDGGMTCGFRFEGPADVFGERCALSYAADLGTWHEELVHLLADVDVLALEFNHDVALERASGRSPRLIARVLGDDGHLSNVQAAALLRQILQRSQPGRLRHLVQLHLSRDCNQPTLAVQAVHEVLGGATPGFEIHTARQDRPGPRLQIGIATEPVRRATQRRSPRSRAPAPLTGPAFLQPFLPGWSEGD